MILRTGVKDVLSSAWMVFRVLKKLFRQFIRRQRCVIHMLRNSFKYVNYNDLRTIWEMFEQVHMAVAMGNAKESVKCAADEITSDCDEDGAAVFLERYCQVAL